MTENETKTCPYCGETILAIAKKCRYCGEWLDAPQPETKKTKECPVCGEEIDADATVCPECHENIADYEKRQKAPKPIAATEQKAATEQETPSEQKNPDTPKEPENVEYVDDEEEDESIPLGVNIVFYIIAIVAGLGISALIMQIIFSGSIMKPHSVALAVAIAYGVHSFLEKIYFTFHG